MFHKEIYEQTEPGSVFLEYLEAQIFENFSARHKPWWHLCGFDVCTDLPKRNSGYITDHGLRTFVFKMGHKMLLNMTFLP